MANTPTKERWTDMISGLHDVKGYRLRVHMGARLLDDVRPGWFYRIDLTQLKLSDSCWCIAGQLSEDTYLPVLEEQSYTQEYTSFMRQLLDERAVPSLRDAPACELREMYGDEVGKEYGFTLVMGHHGDRYWNMLTELWVQEIRTRFERQDAVLEAEVWGL